MLTGCGLEGSGADKGVETGCGVGCSGADEAAKFSEEIGCGVGGSSANLRSGNIILSLWKIITFKQAQIWSAFN